MSNMKYYNNKKGVALIVVAILVVLAVPMTLVFLNMGSSQKNQAFNFDRILKVEQVTLSGINFGVGRLKNPANNSGYANYNGEISGNDRYDLNLTPTGKGFFSQNIYLLLSKAKDKAGKHSSIIMSDAEQFPIEQSDEPANVITHDYWTTSEPYELGVVADVISMRNSRGQNQLRFLDVKKYEMSLNEASFENDLNTLFGALPSDFESVKSELVSKFLKNKIEEKTQTE